MIEWSGTAWFISVGAVVVSGGVAYGEGHWRRRHGLDLGFVNHGGMWGDLLLLPIANAVIVPWVIGGWWLLGPALAAVTGSVVVHAWWHGGTAHGARDHLWPARPHARWAADLSLAGWCHVAYVCGELTVLLAYAVSSVPPAAVLAVTAILSVHVPVGLMQPAWLATGRREASNTRLMVAAIGTAWVVAGVKL